MRRVICAPANILPKELDPEVKYFCTYSTIKRENVGYFGAALKQDILKKKLSPSEQAWDFNTIALSVAAADGSISRDLTYDGWTRDIHLTIHLQNPSRWEQVCTLFEKTLNFLSGDNWILSFKDQGEPAPKVTAPLLDKFDCIALLSGGVDSLVGAIDLVSEGLRPTFVSQKSTGSSLTQVEIVKSLGKNCHHIQLNTSISRKSKEKETSTRARSICFFAFAALSQSTIQDNKSDLRKVFIPENGFISLNIALHHGRLGTLSTKTTHPIYLSGIQRIWDSVGIDLQLVMPYQFKTKGELMAECLNKELLKTLLPRSVSCGKYRVYKLKHCGRCIPCLIRQASFLKSKISDETTYFDQDLSRVESAGPDDVGAALIGCSVVRKHGIEKLILGHLYFCEDNTRSKYADVFKRGMTELTRLLSYKKALSS